MNIIMAEGISHVIALLEIMPFKKPALPRWKKENIKKIMLSNIQSSIIQINECSEPQRLDI